MMVYIENPKEYTKEDEEEKEEKEEEDLLKPTMW